MRPQNRPFVVEIKKTKRGGAPATAGASAAPPPATWAEQFEQATALNDTAARKAAEALFSPPRPATPAPAPAPRADDLPAADGSARKGRILLALGSELEPAAEPEQAVLQPDDAVPARRVGRPRKIFAETTDPQPASERSAGSKPAPTAAAMAPAAPVLVEDQPVLAAPSAAPARKGPWRRGAGLVLARGEKWKRRLPQALR